MKFVSDVWYGRESLARTYWLWGFLFQSLVVLILAIPFTIAAAAMGSPFPFYVYIAMTLPMTVWIVVGVWRSAGKRGGFWGGAARIAVVVGGVLNVVRFGQLLDDLSRM